MNFIMRPRYWVQCIATVCFTVALSVSAGAEGVDLRGIWQISPPQTSFEPKGGFPFTDLGKQVYEDNKRNQAKGNYDEYDTMRSRCASPGIPRAMLMPQRLQILQQSGLVMMTFEWNRLYRMITLPSLSAQADELASRATADLVGTMMGISKGHWEGDTLVVITDKFSDKTLIDDVAPHGYDMKITERIRLKNANTLEDRITIEDPEYFTHSWETALTYKRQPEAVIPEDICLDRLLGPPPLATK